MYALLSEVYPFLVGFFLLDCVLYLRSHRVAFVSAAGRRFRAAESGLILIPPWPTARLVVAEDLLLGASERGLHVVTNEVPNAGPLPDVERFDVADPAMLAAADVQGRRLVDAKGRRLCIAASHAGAGAIRQIAARVAAATARGRSEVAARTGDIEHVRQLRASLKPYVRKLQFLSSALWLEMFVVVPWAVYVAPEPPPAGLLAVGLAAAYGACLWVANQSLAKAGLPPAQRRKVLLPVLLFPPSAGHILAVIERDLYQAAAPVTVAAELLPPESFLRLASRRLRRVSTALRASAGSVAEPVWRTQVAIIESALKARGESAELLLGADPPRQDDSAAGWCSMCGAEYRAGVSECSDCRVELTLFS